MEDQGGNFGLRRTCGAVDVLEVLKRPFGVLRVVAWVFAVVVFACISDARSSTSYCTFGPASTCSFGVAIGVFAFLAAMAFTVLEAWSPYITSLHTQKNIMFAELWFSGIWSFLWFICFCVLTDNWQRQQAYVDHGSANNARAAITFSFFSIFVWALLAFKAYKRYQTSNSYESYDQPTSGPYSTGNATESGDAFHSSPFSMPAAAQEGYHTPSY
uniref:synaptogyrin-2-like n=1 Tax=Myxine glutinosa TaxID=7769 RepID=UPI00358DF14E